MDLQNQNIVVLGLGKTGHALCEFLLQKRARVFAVDDLPREMMGPNWEAVFNQGVEFFTTDDAHFIPWKEIRFCLVSPGVSLKHPVISLAASFNIEITGELEFANQFTKAPVIAITGTNGKSTTTELVGQILKNAGLCVEVGGNLGEPWISMIARNPNPDWFVLEVSSYQLETTQTFHPHIAALLNITDDHFERHGDIQGYTAAKARIGMNQNSKDFLVYNANDVHVLRALETQQAKKIPFSSTQTVNGIFWKSEKEIFSEVSGKEVLYSLEKASLQGLHNIENMMAAIAMAELAKVSSSFIQSTLESFKALPHRLEWVREFNEVDYYDDSKGTNVGAVVMSLASFEKPVVLILGGKDKGGDYSVLRALVKNKAKALILLGEAKEKIHRALKDTVPIVEVNSMKAAVQEASRLAEKGDVVLLSPACSSFDMFRDYKHRGQEFQKQVKEL